METSCSCFWSSANVRLRNEVFEDAHSICAERYVPVENVMKTPQFWMAFTMLGCLATSGLAGAILTPKQIFAHFFFVSGECGKNSHA